MTVGKGSRIGGEGRGNQGGGGGEWVGGGGGIGEGKGGGREAWAHGPGHRLSNVFKPDLARHVD